MKIGMAFSLLLLAASAAIAGPAEPATGVPALAPASAQGILSGQETPALAAGAETIPAGLPWVLATDFSSQLGKVGSGACGAKAGPAAFVTKATEEIPPPPQFCCISGDTICCPARRTCVLCDLLVCCNPL